jgi:hypothetical protein
MIPQQFSLSNKPSAHPPILECLHTLNWHNITHCQVCISHAYAWNECVDTISEFTDNCAQI